LQLHQCDVADHQQVKKFYQQVEEEFDTIDILVNNAGIRRDSLLALMDSKDWQQVIDVNLTGSFNMCKQAVLLMMKQKYGRIINITSPVAHLGFAGQANYAASKAGQIAMTKCLAKETARKKITVNCVSPGFISTDLLSDLSAEQLATYKNLVPMRRFGTADEVAHAVLFLASQQAAYITGTVLEVSGGLS
jgi:3-oxoacyl-[acyl-carrier protein] reductase